MSPQFFLCYPGEILILLLKLQIISPQFLFPLCFLSLQCSSELYSLASSLSVPPNPTLLSSACASSCFASPQSTSLVLLPIMLPLWSPPFVLLPPLTIPWFASPNFTPLFSSPCLAPHNSTPLVSSDPANPSHSGLFSGGHSAHLLLRCVWQVQRPGDGIVGPQPRRPL